MSGPSVDLRLRVVPGARRTGIVGPHAGAWKVRVAAPPEHGRANAAVLEAVAKALGVPERSVELVRGRSSRDKLVSVRGLSASQAESRLAAAAGASP